jgi:hypothetical protein
LKRQDEGNLGPPFGDARGGYRYEGASGRTLYAPENLAEDSMKPAQLAMEGSIALPVLLRVLAGVPRGVRIGGLLGEQQEEDIKELDRATPGHICRTRAMLPKTRTLARARYGNARRGRC